MRNNRRYERRYRRPEAPAAFLSDHLERHPIRTVLIIAPLWLAIFAAVSIGIFELAVNLFCMHILGLPFHFYTYSSVGTIAIIGAGLGGRNVPEGVESALLIGAIVATLVCWYLFRSEYDLE